MLLYLAFSPLDAFAINPILNVGLFNTNLTILTNLGLYLVIALVFIYLLFGNSIANHNTSDTNTIVNSNNNALFAFSSTKASFTDQLVNYFNLMLQESSLVKNTSSSNTSSNTTSSEHLDHAHSLALGNLNLGKALKAAKIKQLTNSISSKKVLTIKASQPSNKASISNNTSANTKANTSANTNISASASTDTTASTNNSIEASIKPTSSDKAANTVTDTSSNTTKASKASTKKPKVTKTDSKVK